MAMRKRVRIARRKPIEEAEIIVIPMIDVMMFLLFFFMVASLALVVQAGLPVNLPKASTANESRAQNVTITIRADGRFFVNTKQVLLENITTELQAMHIDPKSVIVLNADKHIPFEMVIAAMNEARKADISRFTFATER
jgi:biopolymer transport protein ExbD